MILLKKYIHSEIDYRRDIINADLFNHYNMPLVRVPVSESRILHISFYIGKSSDCDIWSTEVTADNTTKEALTIAFRRLSCQILDHHKVLYTDWYK